MDFGLGRYLEMFEERFGHRATTGLIAFITIGLVAAIVPLIWANLCLPFFRGILLIISGQFEVSISQITWRDGFAFLGTVFMVIAPLMGAVLIGHIWLDPRFRLTARKMSRLRVRAMTGGKITPSRIAVDRRTKITVWVGGVFLIIAVFSATVSSTLARRQLVALEHQVKTESERKTVLEGNLDIIERKADIIVRTDNDIIEKYKNLCRKTKDKTCEATIQTIFDERAKSFQSLPHLKKTKN